MSVSTARKRHANRMNSRACTGPRTAAGKARSAQNARRHGLTVSALHDPTRLAEFNALAIELIGNEPDELQAALARRITAAQIDVLRVRHARRGFIGLLESDPVMLRRIASLDRYERYALTKRRAAVREFDARQSEIKAPAPSRSLPAFCQNETNE